MAPVGPDGGTAESPGRQKAVRSRPGSLRAAVIVNDGGHCNLGQTGVGERAGLRGTAGL